MYIPVLARIQIVVAVVATTAGLPIFLLQSLSLFEKAAVLVALVMLSIIITRFLLRDMKEGLSALEIGLLNLKDGEFSTTLNYQKKDEIGQLCALYNDTVNHLRDEKHWLYQRELLLDKVTQSSPDVLFLLNAQQQIIFSNITAREFFNQTSALEGELIDSLLVHAPVGVSTAIDSKKEGLFTLQPNQEKDQDPIEAETWHLSTGQFLLNNQSHTLFILKQMTRELSRQEVSVWKKVIRVISHELNNSLGPISSMLHSGKILSEKLDEHMLTRVFSTIDERIKHLSEFVQGYGKFAKLPLPRIEAINWQSMLSQLSQQWQFSYNSEQQAILHADPAQFEQLMINLLKNAHESGSLASDVSVELAQNANEIRVMVKDRGKGIADSVMNSALIPFYSTKASGTGLGLALCREITDAHHGHIGLYNREDGGLTVRVVLPKL